MSYHIAYIITTEKKRRGRIYWGQGKSMNGAYRDAVKWINQWADSFFSPMWLPKRQQKMTRNQYKQDEKTHLHYARCDKELIDFFDTVGGGIENSDCWTISKDGFAKLTKKGLKEMKRIYG